MKRSFSSASALATSGLGLIAATYGLVRLAFGLFLPDIEHDLGFGAVVAGRISSASSVAYCIGAIAGFVLAAQHARLLVVLAVVTAGSGAIGMAASPDTGWFAAWSIIGSIGAGVASPALVRLVDAGVAEPARARAQAVVNSGTGPGLVGAGVLALVLLPDWRTAWAWSGVFTIVVGALLLVATRGRSAPGAGRVVALQSLPGRPWFRAHLGALVVALLFGAGTAAVWTSGRAVLVDAGASTTVSVAAWIAIGLGGTAVVVTARWTSRLAARPLWALTTAPVAVAVLAIGLLPTSTVAALGACVVFGWGYTAGTGALIARTVEVAPDHAAAGTSMLFVVLVLGQAVGAAVFGGMLGPVGAAPTFVVAATVTALGAVGMLGLPGRVLRRARERPA
ncbi:MFS transporter [Curtobacterium sp. ISL-83]|uniref:MFS transporter n=1 Tax=Curtobacterium sp. ISL-83 TaxID=2819145 RepID=UPI001BE5130B|nr:MFS transporter [Curtobacterium sp. ISL-83]MBT2501761.1 YbfB/YjiJ family MFS transporter [Curtobacterium sp. ISL-83]